MAKKLQFTERGPTIKNADLDQFRRKIGRQLPDDYRDFLLRYNGGCPEPYSVDVPGHDEECMNVRTFFGLLDKQDVSGLAWNYEEYSKQFGADLLPIAMTDTNDILFLNLGDDDPGAVSFWDSMEEDSDRAMYRIASSFGDLLDKIYEEED